jgi:hypothetical protein
MEEGPGRDGQGGGGLPAWHCPKSRRKRVAVWTDREEGEEGSWPVGPMAQ